MEYVVGPVIALLLGMKFTAFTTKKQEERIAAAEAKIEMIENEMPKRLMASWRCHAPSSRLLSL